jgi:hypothetical protein
LTRGGPQRNRSLAERMREAGFAMPRGGSLQASGGATACTTWLASTDLIREDLTIEFKKIRERGLTLRENRRILAFVNGT